MLHLPVRGNGDGGIYTTAADVHALWDAVFAGRIVSLDTVAEMLRPRSDVPEESMRYGLGFWLYDSTGAVSLHGVRCRRQLRLHPRSRTPTHLHRPVQQEPWGMAGQSTPRPAARTLDLILETAIEMAESDT